MKGFDEWFFEQLGDRDETQPPFKIARMWATGAYKAGATSRQVEIENSYKIGYQEGFGSRQAEIDELQKRIDEVTGKLESIKTDSLRPSHHDYDKGWRDCAITVLNDLKGV